MQRVSIYVRIFLFLVPDIPYWVVQHIIQSESKSRNNINDLTNDSSENEPHLEKAGLKSCSFRIFTYICRYV